MGTWVRRKTELVPFFIFPAWDRDLEDAVDEVQAGIGSEWEGSDIP